VWGLDRGRAIRQAVVSDQLTMRPLRSRSTVVRGVPSNDGVMMGGGGGGGGQRVRGLGESWCLTDTASLAWEEAVDPLLTA
jgi:hypothetical protein